jgi:hypothetical protein
MPGAYVAGELLLELPGHGAGRNPTGLEDLLDQPQLRVVEIRKGEWKKLGSHG